MASFVALNVEPEEDSEEEIDDTKEIQIEEALKLYQNALKLHSQGPAFYREADAAYDALFDSEIFSYPEALSDSKRLEVYDYSSVEDDEEGNQEPTSVAALPPNSTDGTPSTLPQLLYLSYKNHGQFLLDRLAYQISSAKIPANPGGIRKCGLDSVDVATAVDSLEDFAAALERDDTDSELWRRTSRIGSLIGSPKLARYCLEAIVHGRGLEFHSSLESIGLEGFFAGEDLKDLILQLQDGLSEVHLARILQNRKQLSPVLRKVMDTCPTLPSAPSCYNLKHLPRLRSHIIPVPVKTWASVGKAILRQINMEAQGLVEPGFGARYTIIVTEEEVPSNGSIPGSNGSNLIALHTPSDLVTSGGITTSMVGNPIQGGKAHESGAALIADLQGQKEVGVPDNGNGEWVGDPSTVPHDESILTVQDERQDGHDEGDALSAPTSNMVGPYASTAVSLPTRKRTSESAGLPEVGDSGRVRSKRIRARAEIVPEEENEAIDLGRHYEERLQEYLRADQSLDEVTNIILSKLGFSASDISEEFLTGLASPQKYDGVDSSTLLTVALQDFKIALVNWDFAKSTLLLQRSIVDESISHVSGEGESSFAMFLEYAKGGTQKGSSRPILLSDVGLSDFLSEVNLAWTTMSDLITQWTIGMLQPNEGRYGPQGFSQALGSRYIEYCWTNDLKAAVVQILVSHDETIFSALQRRLEHFRHSKTRTEGQEAQDLDIVQYTALLEVFQTIFELHVDIYGSITHPSSKVDETSRQAQRDRLMRWASLTNIIMSSLPSSITDSELSKTLVLRHLWSSVMYVTLVDAISRDHILLCLQDLKKVLKAAGSPVIELQNNAIMPEISVEAADREIAKLTTMDFFSGIFASTNQDPLAVVESLEPILFQTSLDERRIASPDKNSQDIGGTSDTQSHVAPPKPEGEYPVQASTAPSMQQVTDFLNKAGASLRLLLWHKLRTAYKAIDFPPMVLLCCIKSMQLIMQELQSSEYGQEKVEDRIMRLVRWLGDLHDLLIRALRLAIEFPSAFDCMDDENLQSTIHVCCGLTRFLHVFVLWDDSVRVGQSVSPSPAGGTASTAFKLAMNQLREMYLRAQMLKYLVLKEAISQDYSYHRAAKDDLVNFIRLLHNALGVRCYCKSGKGRFFLQFAKTEVLSFRGSDGWEADMGQIIFDLYGLKICPSGTGSVDHGCVPESIDRARALELVDLVTGQAQTMNVKDLLKTELKGAIDKMQGVLGAPNPKSLVFNRRVLNAYLKLPINPVDMYRSLKGIGSLSGTQINTDHARIAQRGWYFLLGYMTFTKFRSQKRVSPVPTDDLDIAITFFRHDLEFDTEKWETWYRLAQVYDAKIEEDTTWNSDKLNGHMGELVVLQQNAIRCYMMAVAAAVRCADESFEAATKVSELYSDFANRIYSSSRAPFSMLAFDLQGHKRFCNNHKGTYERLPFRPLHERQAWLFASVLYRQALVDKPTTWMNWYMLGKCLWKLNSSQITPRSQAGLLEALEAYITAIQCVPEKRDNRHPDKDPVLEPHYKLVSTVHKLVQKRYISPEEGCRYLDNTHYASRVPHIQDADDWEGYILKVLKSLRAADKANWHHRMIARAAHVIYDDSSSDFSAQLGAKHEFTQQIFTKTMSVQVWKPEYERAGRHFVYTGRYVSFFVKLLVQLGDRVNLEALGRRVRKKPGDFVDHASVWSEVCTAHLKLLRFQGSIPEGHEDTIFKLVSFEAFNINASRLESWSHSQSSSTAEEASNKIFEVLREAIELKRTNLNLMKSTLIDDLIGDTYALLYDTLVPKLIAKSNDEENRDRMRVNHLLTGSDIPSTDGPSGTPLGSSLDQPIPRVRLKGVGRRDIGRKAEALVAKPACMPPASKSNPPVPGPTSTPSTMLDKTLAVVIARATDPKDDGAAKEVASSVPGSVHDSADDESELSDIGEEEGRKEEWHGDKQALFPGLLGRRGEGERPGMGEEEMEGEEEEGGEEGGEEAGLNGREEGGAEK